MKIVCQQCGKEFVLEDGEVEFYKSKGLALPKRCKRCRNSNKKKYSNFKVINNESDKPEDTKDRKNIKSVKKSNYQNNYRSDKNIDISKNNETTAAVSSVNSNVYSASSEKTVTQGTNHKKKTPLMAGVASIFVVAAMAVSGLFGGGTNDTENQVAVSQAVTNEAGVTQNELQFRNDDLYYQHYEKHGVEMGFASAEEYLEAANAVVNHPDVLHKFEAEDGDDVYFVEATGEFVVVSTDGYIRTYYIADKDYFDRQQ